MRNTKIEEYNFMYNLFLCCLCIIPLLGCSHRLEVKNLYEYENLSILPLKSKVSFGIKYDENDINLSRIVRSVGDGLQIYSSEVIMPFNVHSRTKVDVITKISINPEYEGSGWNFLINFPGFLIWAPAWHGYIYSVKYNVTVSIISGKDNKNVDETTFPIMLKVRHSEFDRTWTEISWFEVGSIAFIGGLYSITYDADITPELITNTKKVVGEYIAQKIIARVNASGQFGYIFDPYDHDGGLAKIR